MTQAFSPKTGSVLIVEDEPLLLLDAIDLAEDAGFVTYAALNAVAAIAHLEQHSDISVMFTDVDMPGSMDGLMLAREVRERWPSVGIIVTSGHVRIRSEDLPTGAVFFDKPYVPARILEEVRKLAA